MASQLVLPTTEVQSDQHLLEILLDQFNDTLDSHYDLSTLIKDWAINIKQSGNDKTQDEIIGLLNRLLSEIDEIVTHQINIIIHNPHFQQLESSWRGLAYLVSQCNHKNQVKIKFLDITWSEIGKDISKAIEFDQSNLFAKIYSNEYGLPGGEPYGVILGDYEISNKTSHDQPYDDIFILNGLSTICAAAFSPFVAGASANIFGIDHYSELSSNLNVEKIFKSTEYIQWNSLRKKIDSRFIGLTMPHILMRQPYNNTSMIQHGVIFEEDLTGKNSSNYLWGNACYAFGAVLIREFLNVGWFGHIRGVPRGFSGGGLLTDLTYCCFDTDKVGVAAKYTTDVLVTDSLERRLSELGFMPLCHCYDTSYASFNSNQSIQDITLQSNNDVHINAKLSTMLQHILCGSRIAHYLKVIIRDKVGSFITADECERYLQTWLHKYTTGREDLEWDEQARFPLREALATVKDQPGKPGQYICIIHLKPHYQLDNMVSELELVTELSQS